MKDSTTVINWEIMWEEMELNSIERGWWGKEG
jgi:hypothetical protein